MLFTGTYEHTLDSKNRLSIPAPIRAQLSPRRDGNGFYVVPGRPHDTLWLYTQRYFENLAGGLTNQLIPDDDLLTFEQEFFPSAELVAPDPQGRVVLPERMLRRTGLPREVVVCGVRDHLEIWRRDQWESRAESAWKNFSAMQLRARRALEEQRRQTGSSREPAE
jgi:MraZ protein